jgi:glutathionyl-hydroquinone reductase
MSTLLPDQFSGEASSLTLLPLYLLSLPVYSFRVSAPVIRNKNVNELINKSLTELVKLILMRYL